MATDDSPAPFAGCISESPDAMSGTICLLGLPCDLQSSYRKGAADAPRRIREAVNASCYNAVTDSGVDLTGQVIDLGDLAPRSDWAETMQCYAERTRDLFASDRRAFFLGGDHAVTIPVVQALDAIARPVHVLQFDAHPDLYPDFQDDPFSHACTAHRILEMPHVASLTILGVRTLNPIQRQAAERFSERLRMLEARHLIGALPPLPHLASDDPVYLTLDLDVFDPAHVPGVAHPVPGGLSPRQVLNFLADAPFHLVGMDAVEVNPSLDVNSATAVLAGRMVQQGMGRVDRNVPPASSR